MAGCASSVRDLYFPSSTTPTTSFGRVPRYSKKRCPNGGVLPNIIRANVALTKTTGGELASSCQVNFRPESNRMPEASR